MDEERIGLVLAKTSELRFKVSNCINRKAGGEGGKDESIGSGQVPDPDYQEEDNLLNIKDALESLEAQLSSLQALQQQQWYEKEEALTSIRYGQKKLLKELKEYRGKDLEVIREAISFASETEENSDLLLPPYPNRPSHSTVSDNGYLLPFPSTSKVAQSGRMPRTSKNPHKSEKDQGQCVSRGPFESIKSLIGAVTKTTLTIVGVLAILSAAGFETRLRKRDNQFKLLDFFQLQRNDEKKHKIECPSGKVPMIEDGEMRCVVKERVEVPFESLVAAPDVNYGCG